MHRPVILVSNRLLQSLSGGDYGLLTPHLMQVDRHNEALTPEFLADLLGAGRTTVTAVARALQAKGVIRGNYERLPPDGR